MPSSRPLILLAALVGVAVALGVPAALGHEGDGALYDQQREVDERISGVREEIEEAKQREGVLSSEIEAATSRIRALEGEIAVLGDKVAKLESELAAHRERLEELRELYRYQTDRLELLREQHAEAQRRLERRLVQLYETEQPDEIAILLQAGSLNDLIEQIQLFSEIARQDRRIADELQAAEREMQAAREQTADTKARVAEATAALAERTDEQRAARDDLVGHEQELEEARAGKQSLLASVRESRQEGEEELDALLAVSAEIAAKIKAAQEAAAAQAAESTSSVSPSGFVWPVQGVLTSTFGPRWGRMHEGIDIGAPGGTPIHAVAAGTIIFAGWLGGYGNLTIIDHGGGIATAYGHQSAMYVTGGSVSQGQAIGAVGSTGNSTGSHLHFEVRVNGSPVDPLGYL